MSTTSFATIDEVDTTPNELFCNIGEYIDCLGDKKMKKMSNTLKMVKLCLMKRLELNTFQDSLDYICTSLMNIIHREKVTSDVTACCQIIVLLEVIFGLDSSTVYSVCYDALVQTVRTTKNKQVAVDCLHAATILLYINDSPNEVEDEFVSLLTSILTNPKPTSFPLVAEAASCWVLLMSLKPKQCILSPELPAFVEQLLPLLELSDMTVRIRTAQCLAFINELLILTPSYPREGPLELIADSIHGALNEYNRYWKESRDKDLKMMLREISRSCEGDGHPNVKLTFKDRKSVV